jgi:hypothetical protein
LEIDHIDGEGTKHRSQVGRHITDWLIRNNMPDGFQILCANCNRGKGKFGECPHKQEPPDPSSSKRRLYRKRRLQCIEAYGGVCQCCGETNWAFLEFDHVDNDGAEHRNIDMMRWMIQNNFPKSIQLLCSNCNKAKGLYGECPHTKTATANAVAVSD